MRARVQATSSSETRWRQGAKERGPGEPPVATTDRSCGTPGDGVNGRGLALVRQVQGGLLPVFDGDLARLRLQLLVDGLDLVIAGGEALDLVVAVLVRDREEWVVEHGDVRAHPR